MRKTKLLIAVAFMALIAVGCGQRKGSEKILVLYYSQTGNTKAVAEEMAKNLKADIEELSLENPYDGDFQATIERCKQEREDSTICLIRPIKANIEDYDIIFIGYPVWFGTFAPPLTTLFLNEDFSGKKIVPFCTFGSGGLESSAKDIAEMQPNAEILPGFGIRAALMDRMPKFVKQFLVVNDYIKGKEIEPVDFEYPHPIMESELDIYNTAVGDYPMLNAEPFDAAMRSNNGSIEYCFNAIDKLREDNPDMPADTIKVYVLVTYGVDTVFTRVVR
ncbi:MAG: NAD(P)H-dependent oxidoreductase [Bacteroidales bacterium]|nr:NAD(P)H-dependent oxidoreductase [Bacteroidales bacterium]